MSGASPTQRYKLPLIGQVETHHARKTSNPCSNSKETSPFISMRDATHFLISSPSALCSGMLSYAADARIARLRNGFSWWSCVIDVEGATTTNGKCGVILVLNVFSKVSAVSIVRKPRLIMSSAGILLSVTIAPSALESCSASTDGVERSAINSVIFDSRASIFLSRYEYVNM